MSLEDIWKSGLEHYSQGEWGQTIDLMEEALRLFNDYENQTYTCLQNCKEDGQYGLFNDDEPM